MVIRAVAIALQGWYVSLMRRVEDLTAMHDRAQAVKLFASEIPGALSLQRHFHQRLQTSDWLPHLAKRGLLGEPLLSPDAGGTGGTWSRQWPAGNYLLRMAESPDPTARKGVAEALREVASSKHPDIQNEGIEILGSLPPDESAPLADLAVGWFNDARYSIPYQASEKLLKNLAEGGHGEAALRVARALLQLWDHGGQIASLYSPYLYAARLPVTMSVLTKACGEVALRLFVQLLEQAAMISGKIHSAHYSSRPIANDQMAKHDIYEALISAVRSSAKMLIKEDSALMRGIMGLLESYSPKIFVRLLIAYHYT